MHIITTRRYRRAILNIPRARNWVAAQLRRLADAIAHS